MFRRAERLHLPQTRGNSDTTGNSGTELNMLIIKLDYFPFQQFGIAVDFNQPTSGINKFSKGVFVVYR